MRSPTPPFFSAARRLAAAVALLAALLCSRAARAEDGPAGGDAMQKMKEQVEKILRLMRENERALLDASTGIDATPTKPKVDVEPPAEGKSKPPPSGEPPPPSGGPSGDGSTGSSSPNTGDEIRRRLQELIEGQRRGAKQIPEEIAELVRLIPTQQGQGQGQKSDSQSQPTPKSEQEARDERRRRMEEEDKAAKEREQQQKKEPGSGDPRDRTDQDPGHDGANGGSRDPNVPPWAASLPPQVRDSIANGRYEQIPSQYQDLVRRYLLWLHRQHADGARPGGR